MTLIKLKDDEVTSVLPLYSENEIRDQFDEFFISTYFESMFTVKIEFENSEDFRYASDSCMIDESYVSDTINYLFSDTSKFSELTAEEFKENLKKYLDSL